MKTPKVMPFGSRRAFTLIELLTVIAIIGILAAILIPVTSKVRDRARTSSCLSNVRQIALANVMYANENKGVFLTSNVDFDTPVTAYQNGNWHKDLARYMNMDRNSARSRFRCPSADVSDADINGGNVSCYNVSRFLGKKPAKAQISSLQNPIVMVADTYVSNLSHTYPWNVSDGGFGQVLNRQGMFRHSGGTRRNVGMTDGSARTLSPIQDGVFKDGSSLLPNLWVPIGGGTSAGLRPSSPTDVVE